MMGRVADSLIYLCDIKDYSQQPRSTQTAWVRQLWDTAVGCFDQADIRSKTRMWGTGDGFYLVIREYDDQSFRKVYRFAKAVAERVAALGIGLRATLHLGITDEVQVGQRRGRQAGTRMEIAGPGLNDAARIVSFASAGQVVFSERFYNDWRQVDAEYLKQVHPPRTGEPIYVTVKHGVQIPVRFDSSTMSGRMKRYGKIGDLIEQELVHLANVLASLLGGDIPDLWKMRLSVFCVDRRELVSTKHRLCFPTDRDAELPGPTAYSIEPENPIGLGIAFVSNAPLSLGPLPDWESNRTEYLARATSDWKLPIETVLSWRRHPRVLIAIPLMLGYGDDEPTGVLCVDCFHLPIEIAPECLVIALRQLHGEAMSRLAPLWNLLES